MSLSEWPNAVTGSPIPFAARICMQRSLSREREIACERFGVNTPIISNWRTTAVP